MITISRYYLYPFFYIFIIVRKSIRTVRKERSTYYLPHSNQISSAVEVFEDTSSSDVLATPIVSY